MHPAIIIGTVRSLWTWRNWLWGRYHVPQNAFLVLLHGLETCPVKKSDLNSLDFAVNRFFMKLFRTGDIDIVKSCQSYFSFNLPSVLLKKSAEKFDITYKNHANLLCQMVNYL